MIRKLTLSAIMLIASTLVLLSQPNILYCDLGSGWSDHNMTDRGAVLGKIAQYNGSGSDLSFLFISQSGVWSPKWVGSSTNYERSCNNFYSDGIYYFDSGSWDHDLEIPVVSGNYYTFITSKNTDANNDFCVLETTYEPVNFSLTNISETEITVGETVDVTVSVAGSINTGERIFIRYSMDNWISSDFIEITSFSSNIGTVTIPAPTVPGTLHIYALSTNQTSLEHSTCDFFTLRYDNNSGNNFDVIVNGSGDPTLTATPDASMIEDLLDERIITLSLNSETFADNSIDAGNISLQNIPTGLSIESVTYQSETEIELALAFDGSDFDVDYSDFNILLNAIELSGDNNLTSNSMTITAIDDQQTVDSAFIAMWEGEGDDIYYKAENFNGHNFGTLGPVNSLYLKSGQVHVWKNTDGNIANATMNYRIYLDGETPGAFVQQNLPFDSENTESEGSTQLWWNNSPDETNLNLLDGVSEGTYYIEVYFEAEDGNSNTLYLNNSGNNYIAEFTYEIPADPILIITSDQDLQEETLDERVITLEFTNTTLIDNILEPGNFVLNNAPTGLSIESITYTDDTHADIALAFDGTDFAENITDFNITANANELDCSTNITSNNLIIYAEDLTPHEGITNGKIVMWLGEGGDVYYNDTEFDELDLGNYNSSSSLYFKSGQLFTWKELSGNIQSTKMYYRFYADGETPGAFNEQDLPFNSEWAEGDTTNQLWWNNGENQNDINLLTGLSDGIYYIEVYFEAETGDSETLVWNNEGGNYIANFSYGTETSLVAEVTIPLTETNLDDGIVNLTLLDETFIDDNISPDNVTLNNAPTGLSIESITYIGSTQILVLLAYDGSDFDTDIPNFNLTIDGSELLSGTSITSNSLTITAVNEDSGIWCHLLTAENIELTLGDNINPWINMEIGQDTWDTAEIGFGLSNTDEDSFTWTDAEWYEDGEGSNKKVHTQLDISVISQTGTYYYGGRIKASEEGNWNYANDEEWSENATFSPEYQIITNPIPDPISLDATSIDGTRIELTFTADNTYNNVIILAKEGSEINAIPVQGTLYNIDEILDDASVIYKGSAGSFTHSGLNQLTTYHYKIYTLNNNYYSNALTSNATTTDEEGCSFELSLGNDTAICGGTAILLNPSLEISPFGDSLTITYDASITSELIDAEKVYMHSGAEMAPENGWEYPIGNWGEDDGIGLMTEISDNIWEITIVPIDYYGYNVSQSIYGIYAKFRNDNGSLNAGNDIGDPIWINMSVAPPNTDFNALTVNFIPSDITSITWSDNSHAPTLSVASSGEYWISATNNEGCIGMDTINIGIQALPIADIGSDTTLCTGEEYLLYPGDFINYEWQDMSNDTSYMVTAPGIYSVTITDEYGCEGFDVVNIQIVNPPVAMFSFNIINDNTVQFTDESIDAETYAWDFENDGTVDDNASENVEHTYPNLGQYAVKLSVGNACTEDSHTETILLLSIENEILGTVSVYPNPVQNTLYIETEINDIKTTYSLIDLNGKIIYSFITTDNITSIDMTGLIKGSYILNIFTEKGKGSINIIKQ